MLQGLAEIVRCVVCLKTGQWPERLKDAEEIDVVEQQLADERLRRRGVARARDRARPRDRRRGAPARHGRNEET